MPGLSLLWRAVTVGSYDDCTQYDTTQCGFQYSDSGQAAFCPVLQPSSWPALMQVCSSLSLHLTVFTKHQTGTLFISCPHIGHHCILHCFLDQRI